MSMVVKLALKQTEHFKYHEHTNGLKYFRHDYFASEPDSEYSPQSYLIQQLPGVINPLHFHQQNQFQVFIEGSGSFGKHAVEPYIVHYAGAFTGYGPIVAGATGLHYLTLRSSRDPGAKFLPAQMDEFRKGPKHHYTTPSMKPMELADLNQLKDTNFRWEHLDLPSGLGVGELQLAPDHAYDLKVPNNSSGIFVVVMQGSLIENTHTLSKNENMYISQQIETYTIQAMQGGAHLLVLQMPMKHQAYCL